MAQKNMNQFARMDKDALYFAPLGGSEQFGMNLNTYICDGKILVVDCGVGFADERFPGIDLILPDPIFLEENRDKVQALVITHAHEDHIGGVAYLWKRFRCPIYTTPFTAAVLHEKFKEANIRDADVYVINPHESFTQGPFKVEFLPVSHSVPDTCSLLISTRHGNILHSGDWNLDAKPVVGYKTEAKTFMDKGDLGILAYVGDSTNAQVPGFAGSEADVEIGLEAEFRKRKGKVAVTIFSSNIGRIISVARAAKKTGRDVGVIGRSMHRMIGCAIDCGYMKGLPKFILEEDLGYLPDERTVLIMTGSQGEPRAALARVARGDHPNISLKKGDTVIFSARSIPGNERNVNVVRNQLCGAGVEVVTPSDTDNVIHVSGHPCRDEISQMLQWVRPQTVIPVHGERTQLDAHASFARECQIPHTVVPNNGSVIRLAPGKPETVDHVSTGILAVDQKRVISVDHPSISQRRKLQYTGAVHVSLALDARGKLIGQPKLELIGLVSNDEKQIDDNLYDEIMDILEDMSWQERTDDHFVEEELRIGVRRFFVQVLGIKPKTTVHVIRV
jgi:ribonuclease J